MSSTFGRWRRLERVDPELPASFSGESSSVELSAGAPLDEEELEDEELDEPEELLDPEEGAGALGGSPGNGNASPEPEGAGTGALPG